MRRDRRRIPISVVHYERQIDSPFRLMLGLKSFMSIALLSALLTCLSCTASAQDLVTSAVLTQEEEPAEEPFEPDLTVANEHLRCGRYQECLKHAEAAVKAGIWNERWYLLKIKIDLILGRYESAKETLEAGMQRYTSSIQLRWAGVQVVRFCGQSERATTLLENIGQMIGDSPWRYSDRPNRIVTAEYLLDQGADPRSVIETFLDRIKGRYPDYIPAYLAIADIALDKRDFQVAAEELQAALERDGTDPELLYRLSRAYSNSDGAKAQAALDQCLEINPRFVPALYQVVNAAIDGEDYGLARDTLDELESINQRDPMLWAHRCILAHLGEYDGEPDELRDQALSDWSENAEVDFVIGRKLSQKYRFREGSNYQRKALEFQPRYIKAKIQLCQDLLRLGREEEGWKLVEEIRNVDKYNVLMFNLEELSKTLARFETLEAPGLLVRMDRREAALYGDEVIALLQEAQQTLDQKYQVELDGPVLVEIFPNQADFAIRTFGLPGGAGYLGVCFGTVITVNGPAAQTLPLTNWRSILWHEYCHAVTLGKSEHRMPRWLSEGLSVYEERQRDEGWGQWMNPTYRKWILDGELTPVSKLSDAFLRPASPAHLDFAYYESSLVVEYLIESQGFPAVLKLLDDLALGLSIEEALTRSWGDAEFLDGAFEAFARERAESFGSELDWAELESSDDPSSPAEPPSLAELEVLAEQHPNGINIQLSFARALIAAQEWDRADTAYRQLAEIAPVDHTRNHWRHEWALVARKRGDTQTEIELLQELVRLNASHDAALQRLLGFYKSQENWDEAAAIANRLTALDPLNVELHQIMAEIATEQDKPTVALGSLRRQLEFPTTNAAIVYYAIADQLSQLERWSEAKQAIIQAIEIAPRYRDAYILYDRIEASLKKSDSTTDPQETADER